MATFAVDVVRGAPGDDEIVTGLEIAFAALAVSSADLFVRHESRRSRAADLEWAMDLGGDVADFCRRGSASGRAVSRG